MRGGGARQRGRRDGHRHDQHCEQQPLRSLDAHLLVEHRHPERDAHDRLADRDDRQ